MSRARKSARWLQEHRSDPFVKRAAREGYRSRAAFKLAEIDDRDEIFSSGQVVVDLGAAPGGWSQLARERIGAGGRLIAMDILPMEPLAEVEFIAGDFQDQETLECLEAALGGRVADLVLSDMAPNISGIRTADQARTMELVEIAEAAAEAWLKPGGAMVVKVFQGDGIEDWIRQMRMKFDKFKLVKPTASRPDSREMYAVAEQLRVTCERRP